MPPKQIREPTAEKKTTAVKKDETKKDDKKNTSEYKNLFVPRPKNIGIGRDKRVRVDLTRMVRWPTYIRLQRQKRVLMKRLKVPPAVNQFRLVADKPLAHNIVTFLGKYKPEDPQQKEKRLREAAKLKVEGKVAPVKKADNKLVHGVNEVTKAIERKQAQLVVIAHDVDPLEVVLFLPALCKKLDIPYVIVKSKSRLGQLVHLKNTACVALTDVNKEDRDQLARIVEAVRGAFLDRFRTVNTKFGGTQLSKRSLDARKKALKKV
ncbi:hypothetical protein ABK040_004369 [Willaertia magna]